MAHINGLELENIKSNPDAVYAFIEQNYRSQFTRFTATTTSHSIDDNIVNVDLKFQDHDSSVDFLRDMFESFKQCQLDMSLQYVHRNYYQDPMYISTNPPATDADADGTSTTCSSSHVLTMGHDGCYYPSLLSDVLSNEQ